MQTIRDTEGDVKGYENNGYYLLKHYYTPSQYSWFLSKTNEIFDENKLNDKVWCDYSSFKKDLDEGFYVLVKDFKKGKELLNSL